jgi:hypothetical protein
MGDGYWDNYNKTIYLCTDNFTREEVDTLRILLKSKLNLDTTIKIRNGRHWRIRFSSKGNNLDLLRSLVKTYMHSEMLYKLNL